MSLPFVVLLALWVVWWASWMLAAGWSKQTRTQLSPAEEARHRVLTIAGVVLLFAPLGTLGLPKLYSQSAALTWTCVEAVIVGFAFAWWARITLGTLWSSNVALKTDHTIVERGPYLLVRHPIYTGIIFAALATALAKGTIVAFAGAALLAASFYVKARMEERLLEKELGVEAYGAYRSRVPMLVPFWPAR